MLGLTHTETKVATLADDSSQTITTTYTYDGDTRRLEKVSGGQYPVQYGYDDYGQMDSLKTWQDEDVASGFVETTWEYDPATGLLVQKRYDNENGTGVGPSYTYWPDGKLKTRTWVRNAGAFTTTYTYGGVTRDLESIDYNDDPVDTPTITYRDHDRLGRPHQVEDAQGTRTLTYTDGGSLDSEVMSGVFNLDREFDEYGRPTGYSVDDASSFVAYGYDTLVYCPINMFTYRKKLS